MTMVACRRPCRRRRASDKQSGLPIVHILVPADFRAQMVDVGHGTSYGWENMDGGLDGIAIDLPALKIAPNATA